MRLITDIAELQRGRPAILTIGSFDGVHRGHQFLIRQVVDRARILNYDSIVMTFDPRPDIVFRPDSTQLTNGEAKAHIISTLGPDVLALLPFNREVSQIQAGQFLVSILDHINMREIWLGADFAFGHKRQGNVDFLIRNGQQSNFAVHVVPRQPLDGHSISSSLIRELIAAGEVERAARFLGHYYSVTGPVVRGAGRGRKLGFPTANVGPPPYQQIPATGIYAAYMQINGERLPTAASVGYNVQFGGHAIVVEGYILDFDADIYDRQVTLELVARVRDERKFESVDALVEEMGHDVERVRAILPRAAEPGELILD